MRSLPVSALTLQKNLPCGILSRSLPGSLPCTACAAAERLAACPPAGPLAIGRMAKTAAAAVDFFTARQESLIFFMKVLRSGLLWPLAAMLEVKVRFKSSRKYGKATELGAEDGMKIGVLARQVG